MHACSSNCCEFVLTLTHYHCTDLGHSFVANFCYRLICESIIFARFSAAGMGVGLYAGWLICEYIWYHTVDQATSYM